MPFNTLRSPHCDDCPGCRTCVLWAEDFDLHGSRPLAAGEVEPVSWDGFTLTSGSRVQPALPSYTPVTDQACEGFTVTGGFGSGWYPAKVLTATGTGTVAITSPVDKGYRAKFNLTVGNPSTNVVVSLTAGLAKIVAYRMVDREDTTNGIAKLYIDGELKALIVFDWPTTGGEWQMCLDVYTHSRTGSMAGGWFSDGNTAWELFAACPCAGTGVTFAVEANPDAVTIDVSYLELLAHNSEAGDAALCPQPAEPCTEQICGRYAEDWQTVLVELPVDCDESYYPAVLTVEAVSWGTSARDGNVRWEWWEESPVSRDLSTVRVHRGFSTGVGWVDLRVYTSYYDIGDFDPHPPCDTHIDPWDNWDPDTLPALAPDSCYCRWPPTDTLVCDTSKAWDFDCAAASWNAYKCWCQADPCACTVRTLIVTPQGC